MAVTQPRPDPSSRRRCVRRVPCEARVPARTPSRASRSGRG